MVMVNGILLKTGLGNPSPVYNPELERFNGWKRQPPTLGRLPPRGRALDHPGHTPALPLADRKTPSMPQHQIGGFPHHINFSLTALAATAVWYTSPPIATPAMIMQAYIANQVGAVQYDLQAALASTLVTTLGQLAPCPLIFKRSSAWTDWQAPLEVQTYPTLGTQFTLPLNIPIPNGPRNRIVVYLYNTHAETAITVNVDFHIVPEW